MDDKKLYQQKMQAQLDELKADLAKLKAKASKANAEAKLEMNKHVKEIEVKLEEGKAKLHTLAEASDDAWETAKNNIMSKLSSLKSNISDAVNKYKD